MGVRTKALVTVLLVGAVIGVFAIQNNNKSLLKGQIRLEDKENSQKTEALPDLKADLTIVQPETGSDDLKTNVTITNLGPGLINGQKPFKYTIYINDIEVFSNTDSYSTMNSGDSFNFVYPISRSIYNYQDKGSAKVVVDSGNSIQEANENNNEVKVEYTLK